MVTLFHDLDTRVSATVARMGRGEHVALQHDPNASLVVADVVDRVAAPVSVRVPRTPDGYIFAALSAAVQCGSSVLSSVAGVLRSPADTAEAAARLGAALGSRYLVVENADAAMGPAEWRELIRPAAAPLVAFFSQRANLRTVQDGEWIAPVSEPREDPRWDSKTMWRRCRHDVETFGLAAARVLLTGETDHATWSTDEIAYDVWRAAPASMQELMLLLLVHGRPLDRRFLAKFDAQPGSAPVEPVVEDALRCLVVQQRAGQLTVHPGLVPEPPLSALEHSDWHRRLAVSFERAIEDPDLGALAVLEAHRHYSEVPDIASAARLAEFGVLSLLVAAQQQSREGRVNPERYRDSARIYQVILDLDQRLVTPSDRRGIGPRIRAYATHYAAFNRYKAGEDSIERTLDAYESALVVWPENALFWSRVVVGKFVAGRPRDALADLKRAYERVPQHPERDALLVERSVERLIRRHLDLAARVVLGDKPPRSPMQSQIRQLETRLASGTKTRVLWTREREVHFRRDVTVTLEASPEVVIAAPELEISLRGGRVTDAVARLTDAVLEAAQRAALDSDQLEAALSYAELLDLSKLARSTEPERWLRYLLDLASRQASGQVTAAQRETVLNLWRRARTMFPALRRPAAGADEHGRLHLAWAFEDLPAQELTIEIEPDGKLDWFFRDPQQNIKAGSEHPVPMLTDTELRNLGVFAR